MVLLSVTILGACQTAQPTSDFIAGDAEKAIHAHNRDFISAVAAGNVDGMMTIYSEEAVLMPPNAPPQKGRAAIHHFWTGFLSAGKFKLTLTPDDITQSCDMATEIGHYTVVVTPAGTTATIQDDGKYVVTWRKSGNQWLAFADIFNSNVAVMPGR